MGIILLHKLTKNFGEYTYYYSRNYITKSKILKIIFMISVPYVFVSILTFGGMLLDLIGTILVGLLLGVDFNLLFDVAQQPFYYFLGSGFDTEQFSMMIESLTALDMLYKSFSTWIIIEFALIMGMVFYLFFRYFIFLNLKYKVEK